ncbi:MAG: hypothetical protein JJU29_22205 [Verrucomicrobia bacterium]|nr:hypothetical protein [Verrucomicrobiota bacterium]
MEKILTADGSYTCRHPGYMENYHAKEGARAEAFAKFVRPGRLADRLRAGPVRLLDVGFGLGVNARAAIEVARETGAHFLHIDSVEADHQALTRARTLNPDCPVLSSLENTGQWREPFAEIHLYNTDIREVGLTLPGDFDLIFHDPFSPMKNTECWTVELFAHFKTLLRADGMLLTYAEADAIRAGLFQAGFSVGLTPPAPPHRGGTLAVPLPAQAPDPLDPEPFTHPPKNIAYHDFTLKEDGKTIRARREAQVRTLASAEEEGSANRRIGGAKGEIGGKANAEHRTSNIER